MNGVISTALISAFPGIHGELALCIVAGNLRRGMKQQMVKVKDRIACWIPQVCVEDWFFTAAYNERDASVIDGVAST